MFNINKHTSGYESVEDYIKIYGFCHWQAQEAIAARDKETMRVVELCFALDKLRQQLKQSP